MSIGALDHFVERVSGKTATTLDAVSGLLVFLFVESLSHGQIILRELRLELVQKPFALLQEYRVVETQSSAFSVTRSSLVENIGQFATMFLLFLQEQISRRIQHLVSFERFSNVGLGDIGEVDCELFLHKS